MTQHGAELLETNGNDLDAGNACDGDWRRYAQLVDTIYRWRKLFRTQRGTYGIGPECMLEGDVIAALFKGTTPCALRSTEGGFLCLGPVYIHALVDGTYFENLRAEERDEQEFILI
ncbi:uncharacterized protein M421DRAFT_214275 [Didymella exigua CBS 183.55]|uniref:Heterokaryon incompatibility domain-containing protein n=1 Tax=Didymella exigua CBS 183.55 TaxID=1150837 RepID=A0A6A5RGD8_9PLEO|nr:uncharacterized protein M421DRAFT_214275 [Didymella exigua CBS 183.55]KAF1926340.1 hypothetical protein M421DRAFT_214275 [Didymella exigua CBS 183.55]